MYESTLIIRTVPQQIGCGICADLSSAVDLSIKLEQGYAVKIIKSNVALCNRSVTVRMDKAINMAVIGNSLQGTEVNNLSLGRTL